MNSKINHDNNFYKKYPYIFHKFLLGISNYQTKIPYNVLKRSNNTNTKHYWAHLHCYNIDKFNEIYGDYISKILPVFNVVLTFSIGAILPDIDCNILKCENRGFDIGPKIIFMDYLNSNNYHSSHLLFLHSKSCSKTRNQYFSSLIDNIDIFLKETNNYGAFIPPFIHGSDSCRLLINEDVFQSYQCITYTRDKYNSNYFKEFCNMWNLDKNLVMFPSGNCYILKYNIASQLFCKDFYFLLNIDNSFDVNWVYNYYDLVDNELNEVYEYYKNSNCFGNNMATKVCHRGLRDGQIEHIYERLIFNIMKKYNERFYVFPYNKNNTSFSEKLFKFQNVLNDIISGKEQITKNTIHNIIDLNRYMFGPKLIMGVYVWDFTKYTKDIEINVALHNLKNIVNFCNKICVIEIIDSEKSMLSDVVQKTFTEDVKIKFHFMYVEKNKYDINISSIYDHTFAIDIIKYINKHNKNQNISKFRNFLIFNSNGILLESLKKWINDKNTKMNTFNEIGNNIQYIDSSVIHDLWINYDNIFKYLELKKYDYKEINGAIIYDNTIFSKNYDSYLELYQYKRPENTYKYLHKNHSEILDKKMLHILK